MKRGELRGARLLLLSDGPSTSESAEPNPFAATSYRTTQANGGIPHPSPATALQHTNAAIEKIAAVPRKTLDWAVLVRRTGAASRKTDD